MKRNLFLIALLIVLAAEIAALIVFANQDIGGTQDMVAVNEAVQSACNDWENLENHENQTGLDYVLLDGDGEVVFKTREGLSETLHEAAAHRDTILDIENKGKAVGKIILYNDSSKGVQAQKEKMVFLLAAAIFVQCCICLGYGIYLDHAVIRPFQKLKGFAMRVAGGNLDIPLEMDRQNLFGAFTESFDLMRAELKKARLAEAQANESKKELVAKLSHDIKTPVASIKAASELGAALTDNEKVRSNYMKISHKADQINVLITDLFTSALEELNQLSVTPVDMESSQLEELLENADYLHYAKVPDIPNCLLYADRLRLQQVFDNIFANSYKYANTNIELAAYREENALAIVIEDYGGGVNAQELPLIKEKFMRAENAKDIEGAGLGLYISDYFMRAMQGELELENGSHGLKAIVRISLSGV